MHITVNLDGYFSGNPVDVSEMVKGEGWKPYNGGEFEIGPNDKFFTFVTRGELGKEIPIDEYLPIPLEYNALLHFDDSNVRAGDPFDEIVYYRTFTDDEADAWHEEHD